MRLSAVIQLVDGFTGEPAVGARVRFLLDGKPCQPLAKAQAFYAFPDLDDGIHHLAILSTDHVFFDQQATLRVPLTAPLAEAIVPCVLAPSPLYEFPAGTTLVRGQVVLFDKLAQPLAGVAVRASYQSARARALQAGTVSSDYGRYAGRYALALGGNLAAPTSIELDFSKAGHASVRKQVSLRPGAVVSVDIEMH